MTHAPLDAEGRRLLWRCRRGMKELDVLLEQYAAKTLPTADSAERAVLERLLELPDPELAGYLLAGRVPAEATLAALVTRILDAAGAATPAGRMIGPHAPSVREA